MNVLNKYLEILFLNLNECNIDYLILRDYGSTEAINNADDLDIVISEKCRKKSLDVLKDNGWCTPRVNGNIYPHQQFFKWVGDRTYKLDICWSLSFDNGKVDLFDESKIYSCVTAPFEVKIPSIETGLLVLICHIVYDKKNVTSRHISLLKELLDKTDKDSYWGKMAQQIVFREKSIKELSDQLYHDKIVKKSVRNCMDLKLRLRQIYSRLRGKSQFKVCVVGVDGSGKSSTIGYLQEYYKTQCRVQYLGAKQYQTKLAHRYLESKSNLPKYLLIPIQIIAGYIDSLYRFKNAAKDGTKLVIYDRYVSEAYINAIKQPIKFVNYILYGLLFPKPNCYIYLQCSVETSLSRKDDIEDVDVFKNKKYKTDLFYKKKNNTFIIDTDQKGKSQIDVRNEIIQYIGMKSDFLVI